MLRRAISFASRMQVASTATRSFSASASTFLDRKIVLERVLECIKNYEKIDSSKVSASAEFKKDLGLDSLDTVEVVMALEEEFSIEIPDDVAEKLSTVEMAVSYIAQNPQSK